MAAIDTNVLVRLCMADDPEQGRRAQAFLQTHATADFADCFILASVRARGRAPLATFDRKLGKLPGAVLI
jgi:predicted nucleic acid-binding protein